MNKNKNKSIQDKYKRSNAYDIPDFSRVRCTRCKHEFSTGGHGQGFCSNCDSVARIFGAKDKSKELLLASRPMAFPAEWIE